MLAERLLKPASAGKLHMEAWSPWYETAYNVLIFSDLRGEFEDYRLPTEEELQMAEWPELQEANDRHAWDAVVLKA